MRRFTIAALVVAATVVPSVDAHAHKGHGKTVCERAYVHRVLVKKKLGQQYAGRNICRFGVMLSNGRVVDASRKQARRYDQHLNALLAPAPYLLVKVPAGKLKPAGVASFVYKPTGLADCIAYHESHYDPQANNGSHWGIGQWTIEAWLRHGGGRFASSPLGANYQQQLIVLSNGLARYGCRDWCPFDPC